MENPLVSIIIPLYNKKDFIENLFFTISNQTYRNIEILVIDDGSTDGSGDAVKKIFENEPRFNYIYQKNKGVSAARNKGINLAKGEYVSFLDADDKYDSNFIYKMVETIGRYNICYCGHYFSCVETYRKARLKFKNGDILFNYLNGTTTPHMNNWLIKTAYLKKYNIYFEEGINWGEDMLFFSKILTHDTNVQVCKNYLTYYSIEVKGSLSTNNIDKIKKDILWINLLKKYLDENLKNAKRKKEVLRILDGYLIPALIIYRINLNKDSLTKIELSETYYEYREYITREKLINGLKSLKLRIHHLYLKSNYVK